MNDLQLEIISPEKVLFTGAVALVEVPGAKGRFSLLRDHAPVISTLVAGQIRVKPLKGDETTFDCRQGYVECQNNKATVLLS